MMTTYTGRVATIIMDILQESQDWMSRKQIAKAMGRGESLTTHDIDVLDGLIQSGALEQEKRTRGLFQTYYVYRAVKHE